MLGTISRTTLQQFGDYLDPLAGIDDRDGAAHAGGVVLPLVVDAEGLADGAEEVGHADRAFDHRGPVAVSLADHLAALDAAADQHAAPGPGPVVAPAAGALGRAAELAHPDDQSRVEQPALVEVLDEGRHRGVARQG